MQFVFNILFNIVDAHLKHRNENKRIKKHIFFNHFNIEICKW